jgi:hypothetical protein
MNLFRRILRKVLLISGIVSVISALTLVGCFAKVLSS